MGIQFSDRVENIVRKEEIAHYEQCLHSHNVFKSCLLLIRQNEYIYRERERERERESHFNTLKKKNSENIVEKGEIALNEQFHLFPQCFLCSLYVKILR